MEVCDRETFLSLRRSPWTCQDVGSLWMIRVSQSLQAQPSARIRLSFQSVCKLGTVGIQQWRSLQPAMCSLQACRCLRVQSWLVAVAQEWPGPAQTRLGNESKVRTTECQMSCQSAPVCLYDLCRPSYQTCCLFPYGQSLRERSDLSEY